MLLKKLLLSTVLSLSLGHNIQANQILDFSEESVTDMHIAQEIRKLPKETTEITVKFNSVRSQEFIRIPVATNADGVVTEYQIEKRPPLRDSNNILIVKLDEFKNFPNLEDLVLQGQNSVKLNLDALLQSLPNSLSNVSLIGIRLGTEGAIALAKSNYIPDELTTIDLRNNGIGPAGLASIFDALHDNKTIKYLNLQYNPLYIIKSNNYSKFLKYMISKMILQGNQETYSSDIITNIRLNIDTLLEMATDHNVNIEKFFNLLLRNNTLNNLTLSIEFLAPTNLDEIQSIDLERLEPFTIEELKTIGFQETTTITEPGQVKLTDILELPLHKLDPITAAEKASLTKENLLKKKENETLTLIKQVCDDICKFLKERQTPMTINLHIGMDSIRLLGVGIHGCRMELPDVLNVKLYQQPSFKLEVSPYPENDTILDNHASEGMLDYIIITYNPTVDINHPVADENLARSQGMAILGLGPQRGSGPRK